jgi:hypothetical protein
MVCLESEAEPTTRNEPASQSDDGFEFSAEKPKYSVRQCQISRQSKIATISTKLCFELIEPVSPRKRQMMLQ